MLGELSSHYRSCSCYHFIIERLNMGSSDDENSIPIFLAVYFGHRIYARSDPWAHDPMLVDLVTGLEEVQADETPAPVYTKWYQKMRVVFE